MRNIFIMAAAVTLMSSCGIYTKYKPLTDVPQTLYGDSIQGNAIESYQTDSLGLGALSWQEMFTDANLQTLISRALATNTDYQTAQLRVDEAAATLQAAKLAYLPSFALAPQASVSHFYQGKAVQTYSVPLNMSWEVDIFGKLRNAKQQSRALYAKSKDYRQAVRTQLIANVANTYYTLMVLREQLSITKDTEEAWQQTLTAARALMKIGRYDESGVSQMEATVHQVHTSVIELQTQITQTENAMAQLLAETPRHYVTSEWTSVELPSQLSVGVPLNMLSSRPDVRMAQRNVEAAFYGVNQARSAFYPSLTLSGSVGWTNSGGNTIVNPGKLLASALAGLTAPIFSRGQNLAQLKIARAQQEEAKLSFTQTLLDAGKEVNDALTAWQAAKEKATSIDAQVASLENALRSTTLLMEHGNNTYLEVLTAQQSLLSAKLTRTSNNLSIIQNIINLYQALGGGQEQ
jgi:outer membrane protein, multidrug efflux system